MTKSDITERITEHTGICKKDSSDILELVLATIKETLADGDNVKITGFGKFEIKQKSDRRGRNPQTGESIVIDARRVITFKPSIILKSRLNA